MHFKSGLKETGMHIWEGNGSKVWVQHCVIFLSPYKRTVRLQIYCTVDGERTETWNKTTLDDFVVWILLPDCTISAWLALEILYYCHWWLQMKQRSHVIQYTSLIVFIVFFIRATCIGREIVGRGQIQGYWWRLLVLSSTLSIATPARLFKQYNKTCNCERRITARLNFKPGNVSCPLCTAKCEFGRKKIREWFSADLSYFTAEKCGGAC